MHYGSMSKKNNTIIDPDQRKRPFLHTKGGRRSLTDLEKCLLLILHTENYVTSRRVLVLAKKFKLCASCSDRSEVFYTGEKLASKGLVEYVLKGTEYIWSLTKKGALFARHI